MTIKELSYQELEQISESQFPVILDFLHHLKQQNSSSAPVPTHELEVTFNNLVKQWQTDTRFLSSTHEMVLHPAYQQIIGMGKSSSTSITEGVGEKIRTMVLGAQIYRSRRSGSTRGKRKNPRNDSDLVGLGTR